MYVYSLREKLFTLNKSAQAGGQGVLLDATALEQASLAVASLAESQFLLALTRSLILRSGGKRKETEIKRSPR